MFKYPMWLHLDTGEQHREEYPEARDGDENLVIA
jgi:hypothetical protein